MVRERPLFSAAGTQALARIGNIGNIGTPLIAQPSPASSSRGTWDAQPQTRACLLNLRQHLRKEQGHPSFVCFLSRPSSTWSCAAEASTHSSTTPSTRLCSTRPNDRPTSLLGWWSSHIPSPNEAIVAIKPAPTASPVQHHSFSQLCFTSCGSFLLRDT